MKPFPALLLSDLARLSLIGLLAARLAEGMQSDVSPAVVLDLSRVP